MAKKQTILDKVELALEAKFETVEMKLRGFIWTIKLKVNTSLPEAHRNYKVTMFLDPEPYTSQIDKIQRNLDAGLFKGEKKSETEAQKKISEIEESLELREEECPDINFAATLTELKYTPGGTTIVAGILDEAVETINKKKVDLREYKIRLNPTA